MVQIFFNFLARYRLDMLLRAIHHQIVCLSQIFNFVPHVVEGISMSFLNDLAILRLAGSALALTFQIPDFCFRVQHLVDEAASKFFTLHVDGTRTFCLLIQNYTGLQLSVCNLLLRHFFKMNCFFCAATQKQHLFLLAERSMS